MGEKRIFKHQVGERIEELQGLTDEVVLIATDLTPSQTATIDTSKVMGFVTDAGGSTSHTAIIARSLNVPAVVGLETATTDITAGDTIIVDGTQGIVILDPDEETEKKYTAMQRNLKMAMEKLTDLRDLPAETTDGVRVKLYANAELLAAFFPGVPLKREVGPHETLLSIEKARRVLGYEPEHSWRDEAAGQG